MIYQANFEVDAQRIVASAPIAGGRQVALKLENGFVRRTNGNMIERCFPEVGDYFVVQDRRMRIVPKEMFERDYVPDRESNTDAKACTCCGAIGNHRSGR